ncbi:Double-strand break repair protein mre11a [Mortierella sp. GBA30]|nr:Double-strand break repair protein mre11a [Mortierella sp. GBA30]
MDSSLIQETQSQEQFDTSQLHDGEGKDGDTFSILVATDNHLGYLEKDPVRGDDSFHAFEEILEIAAKSEVDMILLGGDLFHDNKPSRKTMYITTKLLRKYCMGDKPVSLEFLSDPTDNFPDGIKTVNYMDSNLNVAIPVFSIHGNHDDPSGDGNLCALDQLAMAGLVNYFGRSQEIDKVVVNPILLRKGDTKLALFGIGNIRDERLHQTFLRRNVTLMRPVEEEEEEPWYNLLVLHQNRVMHGPKSYIPEAFLDEFINLVIWGHEHECLIDPVYNPQQGFHVTQPGSSVATSLSEGESKEKHVAILKICKGKFNVQKIRLKSVRPFIMGDLTLAEHNLDPTDQQKVNSFISRRVRDLVRQANENWVAKNGRVSRKRRMYSENGSDEEEAVQGNDDEQEVQAPKPLVRLRVEYSGGYEIFNPQRFGQEFVDSVANPRDIVHFYRRKTVPVKSNTKKSTEMDTVDAHEKLDTMRVENLVQKYLSAQNLSILPEIQLADAVRIYVEKDEKDAVKDFVGKSLDRMQKAMRTKQNIELEEALLKEINKEKDHQAETYAKEHPNGGPLDHKRSTQAGNMDMDLDVNDDEEDQESDHDVGEGSKKTKARPRAAINARKSVTPYGSRAKPSSTKRDTAETPVASRPLRAAKKPVLAADSQDEADEERITESDSEYTAGKGSSRRNETHMVLDTDDDEHQTNDSEEQEGDDDFLVPKRGTRAKGKARAMSPPKPKPASTRKSTTKSITAAGTSGAGAGSSGTSSSRTTAAAGRGASQAASQTPSQTRSRLVTAIGSRRKKLL